MQVKPCLVDLNLSVAEGSVRAKKFYITLSLNKREEKIRKIVLSYFAIYQFAVCIYQFYVQWHVADCVCCATQAWIKRSDYCFNSV